MPLHRGEETFASFEGRPEPRRPLDQADPLVAQFDEIIDHGLDHLAVVRLDQMLGLVERSRAHADIAAAHFAAQRGQFVILGNRRQDQHAIQPLQLEEIADVVEHGRRMTIDRAHHEREFGIADRVEHPFLEVEHGLRIGVVVQQAKQEIAPQRQCAGLRVRRIAEFGDNLLDLLAGGLLEQRGSIDHPAHRLLRDACNPRHVVDRRCRTGLCHVSQPFAACHRS